jgi:hypothetical protein
VIQITINFTSIEAARAALLEIPESSLVGAPGPKAVQAQEPAAGQATAKVDAAPKKTAAAKPQAAASVAAESQASTAVEGNEAAATPTAANPSPTASTASSSTPVDYATLQKAVFTLAGKSREAAASIAAEFKVKTFKELSQDQWAAALEAVNAKLAELEAA